MSASNAGPPHGGLAGFQPEDVLRQAQVQDLSLSPDGATIVYSRRVIVDGKYRTNPWRGS